MDGLNRMLERLRMILQELSMCMYLMEARRERMEGSCLARLKVLMSWKMLGRKRVDESSEVSRLSCSLARMGE